MDKDQIIESLKQENEYLKSLLAIHNIPYEKPKEISKFDLPADERIRSFLSYFVGRNDIFAYQYINKEGKKSFFPACMAKPNLTGYCPGKCSECDHKQYVGLGENELRRHWSGRDTFGIYPLLDGDVCQLLAFDFDDDDFKESALAFSSVCHQYHFDNIIEISSSGRGAHVWLFFEKPIKAFKARKLGTYLLYEAMDACKGVGFESLDRMFPSQDFVPKNGYGNLIVLPLQGAKAKEGKTVFVDSNFIPYPLKDQINALLSTERIQEESVDLFLAQCKEKEFLSAVSKNVLKGLKLKRDDFAKEVIIVSEGEIAIPKVALSDRSVKFIYRLGALPNPDYYEAERQRRSVYNLSQVMRLYREDESFIYLPRGCYDDLMLVLNFLGVDVHLDDRQTQGELIAVSFKGELKQIQKEALDELMKHDNGLLIAPPAFGKTVTAIALIASLRLNTLIIVPNITLLKQWLSRLEGFLEVGYDYKKEKFGQYYGSKKKLTNHIDVACIDSLSSEEGQALLSRYGLVIVDEVHHIGAISYERIIRRITSKYLYGFTATPKRSDKKEGVVYKLIGPIRYRFKGGDNVLEKVLKPEFTFFTFSSLKKVDSYTEMLTALLKDEERNSRIAFDILKAYHEGGHILVLTDRIEHIKALQEKLSIDDNIFIINGQLSAKEKRDFHDRVSQAQGGFVIISTGKYIGEGFDEKKLDTLFLASPFRWNGTLEQYVGRLHRDHDGKNKVEVHDYVDVNVRMFANMYHERLRGYRRLGYLLDGEDLAFERKLYGRNDYRKKLLEDIEKTEKEIVFLVRRYDVADLEELLCHNGNVKKTIASKSAIESTIDFDFKESELDMDAIIIDKTILWYGGINPFLRGNYEDSIMRINDRSVAESFLKEIFDCKHK